MKKQNSNFNDFQKLDLRVGEVISASRIVESRNLISLQVDLGSDYGTVEILTGLADYYKPEFFTGKKFAFLANLEPKKMCGHASNGMIIVADDEKKPVPVKVPKKLVNGLVIR